MNEPVVFATREEFEDAVMAVLAERLRIGIHVSSERSDDYYSREMVTKVSVELMDDGIYASISSAEDKVF